MTIPRYLLIGYDDLRTHQRRDGIFGVTDVASWLVWCGLDIEKCRPHLRQVCFSAGKRKAYALGFKNNVGGFALRRKVGDDEWQGQVGPVDVSFIAGGEDARSLLVFGQFPEFLTYLCCKPGANPGRQHYLILNGQPVTEGSVYKATQRPVDMVQVWTPTMYDGLPIVERLIDYFPRADIGTMEHEYEGHASLIAWRGSQLKPLSSYTSTPQSAPAYRP